MPSRVIDFHDDLGATFCASSVRPPPMLKTASYKEPYELMDGDFALIIVDEDGNEHRKFACQDPGNTWLSLWYLENVESGLPQYAKIAAAENLSAYAGIHDIDMEEMFPQTAALCAESGTSPFRQRSWEGEDGRTEKVGSAPYRLDERRVLIKTASCAPVQIVKEASAPTMFDKVAGAEGCWDDLSPWERRVVALTLEAEEPDFGEFPQKIASYMGETIHSNIEGNLRWRAERVARTEEDAENYIRVAAMAKVGSLDLEDAVETIFMLDERNGVVTQNGYGPSLPDPYLAVYGGLQKVAMWSWTRGGTYVNEHQLSSYVASAAAKIQIEELMTDDMVQKLRKDPIKTFEAMPVEQKMLLARMASSSSFAGGAFRS